MSSSTGPESSHRIRSPVSPFAKEAAVSAMVFLGMCLVVLLRAPQLMEPDDYAYRASIVALSEGHLLLTTAQYIALKTQLSVHGGPGIAQWVHLRNGRWISQKNPGYPFFAVIFQWIHALRLAPLFYGAIGCAGLFYGARTWLGCWGGVFAVTLYCFSGAALIFAWRSTMATFTDASLIGCAGGLLLGVLLAKDDPPARRFVLGALAFFALDGATFIRYTDAIEMVAALIAVAALAGVCQVRRSTLVGWFVITVAGAVVILLVNRLLYGAFFTTGYRSGIVTFRASAVAPNLERMPSRLIESMPMALLGLGSVIWIVVGLIGRPSTPGSTTSHRARRDAVVVVVLGVGWLAIWALYTAYTWTVGQTLGPGNPIHVVRFYVPALGLIALLAAWLLAQLPRWVSATLLVLVVCAALWSYVTPSNDIVVSPLPSPTRGVSPASPTPVPRSSPGGPVSPAPG